MEQKGATVRKLSSLLNSNRRQSKVAPEESPATRRISVTAVAAAAATTTTSTLDHDKDDTEGGTMGNGQSVGAVPMFCLLVWAAPNIVG